MTLDRRNTRLFALISTQRPHKLEQRGIDLLRALLLDPVSRLGQQDHVPQVLADCPQAVDELFRWHRPGPNLPHRQ